MMEQLVVVIDNGRFMLEVHNERMVRFFLGILEMRIGGKDRRINSESKGKRMVAIGHCIKKL
jgi:hypothetical protein